MPVVTAAQQSQALYKYLTSSMVPLSSTSTAKSSTSSSVRVPFTPQMQSDRAVQQTLMPERLRKYAAHSTTSTLTRSIGSYEQKQNQQEQRTERQFAFLSNLNTGAGLSHSRTRDKSSEAKEERLLISDPGELDAVSDLLHAEFASVMKSMAMAAERMKHAEIMKTQHSSSVTEGGGASASVSIDAIRLEIGDLVLQKVLTLG